MPISLTALPPVSNLTAPEGMKRSATSYILTTTDNWVDNSANQMVASDGSILIFNSAHSGYPIALTAPPGDANLTGPERN